MTKKFPSFANRLLRFVPPCLTAGILLFLIGSDRQITAESLTQQAPESQVAAAAVFLLLYAFKSLSVVLPLALFHVAATLVFPLPVALVVNLLGVWVACSVPFLLTRFSAGSSIEHLTQRHPKLRQLREFRIGGDFLFAFFTRVVGLFSCDAVSMYLSAAGLRYWPYAAGSVLGFAPQAVCITLMGDAIRDPSSPQFVISLLAMALSTVVAVAAYGLCRKRRCRT